MNKTENKENTNSENTEIEDGLVDQIENAFSSVNKIIKEQKEIEEDEFIIEPSKEVNDNTTIQPSTQKQPVQSKPQTPTQTTPKNISKKTNPQKPISSKTKSNSSSSIQQNTSNSNITTEPDFKILEEIKRRVKQQEKLQIDSLSVKKSTQLPKSEKTIKVQLNNGIIEIRPNIDKIFSFVCRGYDEELHEPCYRSLRNVTFNQALNFKSFIERYGCFCGDKSNGNITLDQLLIDIQKRLTIKIKEYNEEFMKFYYHKYSNLDIVVGVEQDQPQSNEQVDESEEIDIENVEIDSEDEDNLIDQ